MQAIDATELYLSVQIVVILTVRHRILNPLLTFSFLCVSVWRKRKRGGGRGLTIFFLFFFCNNFFSAFFLFFFLDFT